MPLGVVLAPDFGRGSQLGVQVSSTASQIAGNTAMYVAISDCLIWKIMTFKDR
jgi:hypothetical protein